MTLSIQQMAELQLELAQLPDAQDVIDEVQQREAELQQELDTQTEQGTLQ